MMRRLRTIVLVLLFAVAGAALGRVAAEIRKRQEAGEDPADIDIRQVRIRPADVVPGLVAAVRVRDQPWSWLHIPSWLAAFAVNLAVAAAGGDFSRLRDMAERYAFSMAGIELPHEDEHEPSGYGVYGASEARFTSTAYAPESDPETRSATPMSDPSAGPSAPASTPTEAETEDGTTWTIPGTERRGGEGDRPGGPSGSTGGFTPFRD